MHRYITCIYIYIPASQLHEIHETKLIALHSHPHMENKSEPKGDLDLVPHLANEEDHGCWQPYTALLKGLYTTVHAIYTSEALAGECYCMAVTPLQNSITVG